MTRRPPEAESCASCLPSALSCAPPWPVLALVAVHLSTHHPSPRGHRNGGGHPAVLWGPGGGGLLPRTSASEAGPVRSAERTSPL